MALLGSVAAVLSVRGAERPVLHWTTVAALIALSVVTLSACLVRACREPDAVSWVEQEPAQQRVPGGADGALTGAAALDSGARVMQGDGSVRTCCSRVDGPAP